MKKEKVNFDCKNQKFMGFYKREQQKKVDLAKMFNKFWSAYPKKKSKIYARKCFVRAIKKVSLDKMLCAIAEQKKSVDWTRQKGKYIPHPSSWLNQGCWDDEVEHKETIAEKHARLKLKGEIK